MSKPRFHQMQNSVMNTLIQDIKDKPMAYCLPDFSKLSINDINFTQNFETRKIIKENLLSSESKKNNPKIFENFMPIKPTAVVGQENSAFSKPQNSNGKFQFQSILSCLISSSIEPVL